MWKDFPEQIQFRQILLQWEGQKIWQEYWTSRSSAWNLAWFTAQKYIYKGGHLITCQTNQSQSIRLKYFAYWYTDVCTKMLGIEPLTFWLALLCIPSHGHGVVCVFVVRWCGSKESVGGCRSPGCLAGRSRSDFNREEAMWCYLRQLLLVMKLPHYRL